MGAMTSSLAAKFAFFPPTPPSYSIVEDPVTGKLRFEDIAPAENVEVTFLDTARGQRIAAMFVRNPRARLTVLYSHGNAADLGQVHDLYVELSNMLRVNLLGYDYTGYGASSGKVHDVVDVSHGRGLAAVCKRPFEALFIEGARHCDLEFFPEYLKQLRRFIAFLDQHPPPPLAEGEEDDIARRGKKKPSTSGWTTPLVGLRSFLSPARTPSISSSSSSSGGGTPLRGSASARSSLHFFSSPAPSTTSSSSAADADAEADKKSGNSSGVNGNCADAGAGARGGGGGGGGAFGGWRARLGRPYKAPISELKQAAAAATTTTDSRGGDDAAAHAADTANTAVPAEAAAAEAVTTEDAENRPAVASGADAAGVKA
ncbi:unnamed protein product [Closterium sp. NIES-54]